MIKYFFFVLASVLIAQRCQGRVVKRDGVVYEAPKSNNGVYVPPASSYQAYKAPLSRYRSIKELTQKTTQEPESSSSSTKSKFAFPKKGEKYHEEYEKSKQKFSLFDGPAPGSSHDTEGAFPPPNPISADNDAVDDGADTTKMTRPAFTDKAYHFSTSQLFLLITD
uniref:Uncharacterized protein n=1 Tax=Romanomermis culicivorax TaxID=13658 RepID=A0A915I609_ROMCU